MSEKEETNRPVAVTASCVMLQLCRQPQKSKLRRKAQVEGEAAATAEERPRDGRKTSCGEKKKKSLQFREECPWRGCNSWPSPSLSLKRATHYRDCLPLAAHQDAGHILIVSPVATSDRQNSVGNVLIRQEMLCIKCSLSRQYRSLRSIGIFIYICPSIQSAK